MVYLRFGIVWLRTNTHCSSAKVVEARSGHTEQLEQRQQICDDTILNIHNLGNGVPADPQDKTCQDRPAYTSIRCAAWTKRNKHAPQPARLDTSGPLLQWLHLIRAYSYPDLGIVGSSHLCYDFSHKIHRIGMKEIQGGTERIYPRMLPGVSAAVTGSCASTHFVVRFFQEAAVNFQGFLYQAAWL